MSDRAASGRDTPWRDHPAGVEARAGRFPGPSLIPALSAIQDRLGWLPRGELEALARDTRRPLYEIQGLISFYPHFRSDPPAAAVVQACHDLSCWMVAGDAGISGLRARYGVDADVEIAEVSCLGRCDLAPAIAVNDQPATLADADEMVDAALAGVLADVVVVGRDRPWPNDPYDIAAPRYRVLRRLRAGELDADGVIAVIRDSGLRGMGGAGFPTATKWELVASQDGPVKYVICNADESEPGSFKDRAILATQPHLVVEGMLIGMLVVGAREGTVFIRHEYGPEAEVLRAEIDRVRDAGLSQGLSLEIFVSPGGYILGEETALIECLEGHRGEPRNKPPFPGSYGLWGKPTLMNSVETLAHVPVILDRGAAWWRDQGIGESIGWKFFAVSGDVTRPGVHCVPMGTTPGELIKRCGGMAGGQPLQAIQPGGASSNFLGLDALDVPLDFAAMQNAGSMLGSGAVVALAEGRDLLAAATNVLRFFRNESCGKCVPCRVGSHKAHEILTEELAAGRGAGPALLSASTRAQVIALEEALRKTSICGLGQVALGPVMSVLRLQDSDFGEAPADAPDPQTLP